MEEYRKIKKLRRFRMRLSNDMNLLTDYLFRSFGPEKLRPQIDLTNENGIFKVQFNLHGRFEKIIDGFSYTISDIPTLPNKEVNYADAPVYLYDLSQVTAPLDK